MPSNADLLVRRARATVSAVTTATPVFADRAENAELWDVEGRRYVDFAAGIAVLNTGHRHPRVIAAVREQLDRFTHTAYQVVPYESYIALTERLNAIAPFSAPAKSVLFTTGGEAVENAIKIARIATGRSAVIAFSGGFHGRTMLTLALTGKVTPYKRGLGPMPTDIYHVPFPAPELGTSVEDSLRMLDMLFTVDVDPARVAAIIVEPMQGEGGFHIAPPGFLKTLREVCDAHGILLIADEVQTGFARTGRMFAIEHSGVEPDLVTVAKALGGGFPLSGVIGKAAVMDIPHPGSLGGTYGGSPLACVAALAVLDIIAEEGLAARAGEIGARMAARIAGFAGRNALRPIANVRHLGSMVAFDLLAPDGTGNPDPAAARQVAQKAFEAGVIVLTCGVLGQSIRLLPPLTASDAVIDEGLDLIETALSLGTDTH